MAKFNRIQTARSLAVDVPQGQWLRLTLRALMSLGLAALFLWLLADRLADIDLAAVMRAVSDVSVLHWTSALVLTAISFWAVGHYDAVLHRHFTTGLPDAMTRRAGICAIAISQTLGLGVISGAILRWRMLPGQSLWMATRLTAAMALSFLAGWAVVTATVVLVLPSAPFKLAAGLVLIGAFAFGITALVAPRWGFRWPNAFTLGRLISLCAVDTLAAALAFYLLCPDLLQIPFATLLPVFLLALGAGLASGAPGGLGAFEVALLALLPAEDPTALLGAILAWRLVYYALPALCAAIVVIIGPPKPAPSPQVVGRLTAEIAGAELGLLAQGAVSVGPIGQGEWLLGRSSHVLLAMFAPSNGATPQALRAAARAESRLPALYKCNARTAVAARSAGYSTILIARDAVLCPITYRLQTSSRAGLRRKLRQAEAAGVTVTCPTTAPWPQMDRIAADWVALHGAERGFSMGRYSRTYLSGQRVYVAWAAGQPLAFASFHTASREWTLDLMRHGAHLPNGTMHSLIQAAIDDAARAGIPSLSLASVPEAAFGLGQPLQSRLLQALLGENGSGLARFKASFAPRWQRLYMAAPNRPALAIAAAAVARAILHPPPIEQDHEDYEFASAPRPWQRQG